MTAARATTAAACILALLVGGAAPAEPDGYRMDDYRAPTPATLQGAEVLSTAQAHAVWEQHGAAFIDVLPRPPRPAGLPAGTIWRPRPRADIPGSIWLPDTGYGAIAAQTAQYFQDGLRKATAGDPGRMLVFYCLRNCWMSWNAAKRALSLGYKRVGWYPDGTDGWTEQALPVASIEPEPRADTME